MGGVVSAPLRLFRSETKTETIEAEAESKDLTIINDCNLNEEIQQVIDRNMDTIYDLKSSEADSKLLMNDQSSQDQLSDVYEPSQSNQLQDGFLESSKEQQLLTSSDSELVSELDTKNVKDNEASSQEVDAQILPLDNLNEEDMNHFDTDELALNSVNLNRSTYAKYSSKNTVNYNRNRSSSNITSKREHSPEPNLSVYQAYLKPQDFKRGKRQKSSETDSLSSKSETTEDGDGYSSKSSKSKKKRAKPVKLNSYGQYTQ